MPSIGETTEGTERPGEGWLECIGLSLSRADYPELFKKLGTRHGALNEASFNLPSVPHQYIYAGAQAATIPETLPDTDPVRPGEPNLRRGDRMKLNADSGTDEGVALDGAKQVSKGTVIKPTGSTPVAVAVTGSPPKMPGSADPANGPKAKG